MALLEKETALPSNSFLVSTTKWLLVLSLRSSSLLFMPLQEDSGWLNTSTEYLPLFMAIMRSIKHLVGLRFKILYDLRKTRALLVSTNTYWLYRVFRVLTNSAGDCGKGVWEPSLISTVNGGQTAYIAESPGSDDAIQFYYRWLSDCVEKHDICNPSKDVLLPYRVIDVGEQRFDGTYPDPFLRTSAFNAE